MYGLTDGMQLIADCFASLERIESFLLIEELNGNWNGKGKEETQGEEATENEDGDEKPKEKTDTKEKPFLKVFLRKIVLVDRKQIAVFYFGLEERKVHANLAKMSEINRYLVNTCPAYKLTTKPISKRANQEQRNAKNQNHLPPPQGWFSMGTTTSNKHKH